MKRSETLTHFLQHYSLDNSLLLGFYGGGNYGDELLMEVLAGLLRKSKTQNVSIAYQHPALYDKLHHDFGFARVDMHSKWAMLRAMLVKKQFVVGGGGLWGLDVNLNILFMSLMLLICRRVLGKKVYLLAVGYYDSAPQMGRIAAWCAAKAAHVILARDTETYRNFVHINRHTVAADDMAWHIQDLDLDAYQTDLAALESDVQVSGRTLFMTLRRFQANQAGVLTPLVEACLGQNTDKNIIIALMEPRHVDPAGYRQLRAWQRAYQNIQIMDCGRNPLALFLLFQKYHDQLIFIGPQFHGILSAHLTGVPYLPLAYDNKVSNLLHAIAPDATPIHLRSLRLLDMQRFIDQNYSGEAA